jgi:hypothetical protein
MISVGTKLVEMHTHNETLYVVPRVVSEVFPFSSQYRVWDWVNPYLKMEGYYRQSCPQKESAIGSLNQLGADGNLTIVCEAENPTMYCYHKSYAYYMEHLLKHYAKQNGRQITMMIIDESNLYPNTKGVSCKPAA